MGSNPCRIIQILGIAHLVERTFFQVPRVFGKTALIRGHFVASLEPGPTRMASQNLNLGTLGLFLFKFFRVIKFSFSKMSRPESPARLEWWIRTGARFTLTFSFILTKHFINSFDCGSGFSFGQACNHLQIHAIRKAHKHLTKYIYKEGNHAFSK